MRLRSGAVTLSAAFTALVASISGCSDAEPDNAQICKEEGSDIRVDDERCEEDNSRTHWVYIPTAHGYPAVGEKVQPGTAMYARPASGSISTVRPAGLGGSSYGDSSGS